MRTLIAAWLAATLAGTALAQPRSGASGDSEEQASSEPAAGAAEEAPVDPSATAADPNAPQADPNAQPAQAENADEAPAAEAEPLPWRNSYFTFTNGVTGNT